MQIIAERDDFQTELFEFFHREIEQRPVIRLETEMSALAQQLLILGKEVAVGKATFCMARLRPGIAEI